MKRLFILLTALVLNFTVFNTVNAQSAAKKPAKTEKVGEGKLKKDGTPDKRFKENKDKPETKHLKKDGTPDKRYKENKK